MSDLINRQDVIGLIRSMYPSSPIFPLSRKKWAEKYEPFIRVEREISNLPSALPEQIKINAEDFNEEDLERLKKELENTPITLLPEQPERKKGEWELNKDGNWACPFCEFDPYHDSMNGMNYCPNCGARLEWEGERQ